MEPVQPQASVVQSGLGIRYVGENCYAYNNASATDSETALLEFVSGSGYIVGEFNFNKNSGDGDDIQYQIYLNDTVVQGWFHDYSARGFRNLVLLTIPPFTKVKATATNDTSSTGRPIVLTFSGRVYGAV